MSDFNRRTVVRGAAWTVPVVAVAAHAPAFAASPVTVDINFSGACASTGRSGKGCGDEKALQVPLTLDNSGSATAITFQITSMYVSNTTTAPTGPTHPSGSAVVGLDRIAETTIGFPDSVCGTPTEPTPVACRGGEAYVTVAGGEIGYFWIVADTLGDSSRFAATINYRLLDGSCAPIAPDPRQAKSDAIPSGNCTR